MAIQKQINVVLSGIIDNDNVTPAKYVDFEQGTTRNVSDLALNIEEADMRIIPHIKWNLYHFPNMSNIVVVSRDNDVTVYLLSYFKEFAELGLKKLWIAVCIGDKRRYIPIHHLFTTFGETFCKILLKCHLGSGCDYISKISTTHSALNADPVTHLKSFGEYPMLDEHQIRKAEKYLVKVFDNKSHAENFDKLRYLTH